jgi:hypothetical protein
MQDFKPDELLPVARIQVLAAIPTFIFYAALAN